MKLTLKNNGEDKTYFSRKPQLGDLRELMELQTRVDLYYITDPNQLDEIVQMIVKIFNNQFTEEEFYHGVTTDFFMSKLLPEYIATVNGTLGQGNGSKKKQQQQKTLSD